MNRVFLFYTFLSLLCVQKTTIVVAKTVPYTPSNSNGCVIKQAFFSNNLFSPFQHSDTSGLRLLGGPTDTIRVESLVETSNIPVRVDYQLQSTLKGDTLLSVNKLYFAILPLPDKLILYTDTVPQGVYPSITDSVYKNALFPFKIVPTKTDEKALGISTYDLALMSRHVTGTEPFTSPYKLIAADINRDGVVDAMDILSLRRFILRIDTAFRRSAHWVFIPKTYSMPVNVPSIDSIQQAYYFNPYSPNLPDPFEFICIKIGDVNNSYRDTSLAALATRSAKNPLYLTTPDMRLYKGESYSIHLKLIQKETFLGVQGTFSLLDNRASFENMESYKLDDLDETNFSIKNKTQIGFSWNDIQNRQLDEKDALFTLKIHANEDVNLSEILKITSDVSENAVYTEGDENRVLRLDFEKNKQMFDVYQNQPNPFGDETSVKIQIEEGYLKPVAVKYSVFNTTGTELFHHSEILSEGTHLLHLNSIETGMVKSGIYFLKVETPKNIKTIKLMKS